MVTVRGRAPIAWSRSAGSSENRSPDSGPFETHGHRTPLHNAQAIYGPIRSRVMVADDPIADRCAEGATQAGASAATSDSSFEADELIKCGSVLFGGRHR